MEDVIFSGTQNISRLGRVEKIFSDSNGRFEREYIPVPAHVLVPVLRQYKFAINII